MSERAASSWRAARAARTPSAVVPTPAAASSAWSFHSSLFGSDGSSLSGAHEPRSSPRSAQTPLPAAAPLASSRSAGHGGGYSFHSSLFSRSSSASPSSSIARQVPGCAHLEKSIEGVLGSPVSLDIASGPRKGRSQAAADEAQALVVACILCEEEQEEAEHELAEKTESEDGRLQEDDYLPITVRDDWLHHQGDDDESEPDDDESEPNDDDEVDCAEAAVVPGSSVEAPLPPAAGGGAMVQLPTPAGDSPPGAPGGVLAPPRTRRPSWAALQQKHRKQIEEGEVYRFECRCEHRSGQKSCLAQLNQADFFAVHNETYCIGISTGSQAPGAVVSKAVVAQNAHRLLWALKEPAPQGTGDTATPRKYRIKQWSLLEGKHRVCKAGWQRATGLTGRTMRSVISLVIAGVQPTAAAVAGAGERTVALMEKAAAFSRRREGARAGHAVTWWKQLLECMDFMPNEERVVIRGPSYNIYHAHIYTPAAKEAGLQPLSRKAWRLQAAPALRELSLQLPGQVWCSRTGDLRAASGTLVMQRNARVASDESPGERKGGFLKMGRSAKHSKFPECTVCSCVPLLDLGPALALPHAVPNAT